VGYGKTTLLRQWASADPRPVRWISLTGSHDDPAVLLGDVLGALNTTETVDGNVVAGPVDDRAFLVGVVLPRLVRILRNRHQPLVLVLDGTDHLQSEEAWEVLSALADATPDGMSLALAGRRQPPLPLGRWVTHRRLSWLQREDLRLDQDEAKALLLSAGVAGHRDILDPLIERCSGWAAALHIAADLVRNAPDAQRAATEISGESPPLQEFLRTEVLDAETPSVQQFLNESSVLTELSGERCDAVLAVTGSGSRLADLSRSNVPVEATGHRPDKFRYHPLLADLLQHNLRIGEPQEELTLNRRASLSFDNDGAVKQAVQHARAAHDTNLAAELVWPRVAEQRSADDRPLDHWLDAFSTMELQASPRLALAAAWRAMETGRPLDHWLSAARRSSSADRQGAPASVRAGLALFRAVLAKSGAGQMSADADLAVADSGDDAWRCLACHLAGVARWLLGDRVGARRWLDEGEQLSHLLDVPSVEAQCIAQQAVLALEEEDWAAADSLAFRAMALVERFGLQDDVTMATAFVAFASASARRGERQSSEQAVRTARRLLARSPTEFAPWMRVESRMLLGRVHLLLGDPVTARELLREADVAARSTAVGSPEQQRKLQDVWRMADELPVTMPAGPSSITAAELRVLHMLPSHLSFAEIGNSVFLSRNTVKTQAISTYRKLGVNSRAEAVACARTLGLLDPTRENRPPFGLR
jgi:LuxR family maltose regulon positive regulatory protein